MEEKVIKILESIGLNKNEIKIYLDLLKYKSSSALDISKRTGIHRSNTYDAIRELINLGFISEIIEEKKKKFVSMDPNKLKYYIKHKENEADIIIPYLKSISQNKENDEEVSVAQGVFAARQVLLELLEKNQPIYVMGASKEAYENIGLGFLKEYHKERIKRKIQMDHIYNEDAIDRVKYLNTLRFTGAKYLPKNFSTIAATFICDDIVSIPIFQDHLSIIKIKNKKIADTYYKYFQLLWKEAKYARSKKP